LGTIAGTAKHVGKSLPPTWREEMERTPAVGIKRD
jgi:hypothetical protein